MSVLRIATRQSPLALWQARHIQARLQALDPGLQVELVTFVTQGDRILDTPLAKIGGKGLFVKELERALLDDEADLAVHSLKDVPMTLPEGLVLPVICEREDPRDAWVSAQYPSLDQVPQGAVVGTSSLRRRCQLLAYRPDLQVMDLRGNVGTRLGRLDAGEYVGIILAAAGLQRLGLAGRIAQVLEPEVSLPAVGQGALALECRAGDAATLARLLPLRHELTQACVTAERAMNRALMGGCQVPIAGFAQCKEGQLQLQGRVGSLDGRELLRAMASAPMDQAEALGEQVAQQLKSQGAERLLQAVLSS